MSLDYAICPHCGCHCDDDEFCAACGKLFHDDLTPSRDVSILGVLGSGLRSLARSVKPMEEDGLEVKEDLDFCSSWSMLSTNIYNDDNN